MTPPRRLIAGVASIPALRPHVRLQFDPVRHAWAVLAPESVFWPDETSLEILRRCDGATPVTLIAGSLAAEYDEDEEEIAQDVVAFVQEWSDRLLVRI